MMVWLFCVSVGQLGCLFGLVLVGWSDIGLFWFMGLVIEKVKENWKKMLVWVFCASDGESRLFLVQCLLYCWAILVKMRVEEIKLSCWKDFVFKSLCSCLEWKICGKKQD